MNTLCKRITREGKARLHKIQPTGNPLLDVIRRSGVFAKLLGNAARRVESVDPPVEDQKAVASWIAGIRHEKRLIERFVRALKQGQGQTAKGLARRSQRVQRATNTKADKLGLTACSG